VPSNVRAAADEARIRRFLTEMGRVATTAATIYLSGGATAVLRGWRQSTIDIDLRLEPDADDILRGISALKDKLETNVELASPLDFIPEPPGWRERSVFVAQEGRLTVRLMDPYAQALAKIERDHAIDRADIRAMMTSGLVEPDELRRLFSAIEPQLYRFPAIDPPSFRAQVERAIGQTETASPGP
jgi:hypothetical protein